ncbi:uncharacterized protein BDZ99DRAFT_519255 [Mytilinidion resinicola]|uniref:Zinc finger RING-type eukaryotic domain-containing protein n=1 Tax=Mytilinidion resinicola TaxID=574789 RepID=A0A6A6YVS8_9PEZI|nr:uncharacterized protein BDZ99DRAFT_519255 [Mytilinidion resinicola]KAF2812017.1 hypothetical protein BDZ99DRAFT_519255 [Mytilinidion resinicola]
MSDRGNQQHLHDLAGVSRNDDPDAPFIAGLQFHATKILHLVNNVHRSEWQTYVQHGYATSLGPDARWLYTRDYLRTHLPEQYQFFLNLPRDDELLHVDCDRFLCDEFGLSMEILSWKRRLCRLYNEPWKDPVIAKTSSRPVPLAELGPDEGNCSICRKEFSTSDPAVKTFCGHIMGRECLDLWQTSGQAN